MRWTITENGKIDIPKADVLFLCRWSGLKSRKRRHIKKRIKNIVNKALLEYISYRKNSLKEAHLPTKEKDTKVNYNRSHNV